MKHSFYFLSESVSLNSSDQACCVHTTLSHLCGGSREELAHTLPALLILMPIHGNTVDHAVFYIYSLLPENLILYKNRTVSLENNT